MTLPTSAILYLEEYSAPFGGAAEVGKFLRDRDIEYLLTFPGKVYIAKPWAAAIDLTEEGYSIRTPFVVLDNLFRQIYISFSPDGLFGNVEKDHNLLLNAEHGSFIHIQFETLEEPKVILLWVCNKLSSSQKRKTINEWQSQINVSNTKVRSNEIFISTKYLQPEDGIKISYVPSLWTQKLTPENIKSHPKKISSIHSYSDEIISLYLEQTGWYLFEVIRDGISLLLKLDNVTGVGLSKFKLTLNGSYFFNLNTKTQTLAASSLLSLPSVSTFVDGEELNIRLEASFKLVEPDLFLGSSDFFLNAIVMRSFSPVTANGKSSSISRIGLSFSSLSTAKSFSSLPDLCVSEKLITLGTAQRVIVDNLRYATSEGRIFSQSFSTCDSISSSDTDLVGASETTCSVGIIQLINPQTLISYDIDPVEYLLMFGAAPFSDDPIHQVFVSSEYQPYLLVTEETETRPLTGSSYSAINNN